MANEAKRKPKWDPKWSPSTPPGPKNGHAPKLIKNYTVEVNPVGRPRTAHLQDRLPLNLRLPAGTVAKLKAKATQENRPVAQLISLLILEAIR